MPNVCKCCGGKFTVFNGAFLLSSEFNEAVCYNCKTKIDTMVNALIMAEDPGQLDAEKKKLVRSVDHSEFTQEGKQYILSYIDSLCSQQMEKFQKQKEEEEHKKKVAENRESHKITTGYNFEGFHIGSYLGVMSGSVVLGTGFLSEFNASFSDFFGTKSNSFSNKIESAREGALSKLKDQSANAGGNALIGVDFDYITFAGNMIGVVASGTSVLIEKEEGKLA